MNYWNQTPLFRLLPAFILGILAAVYGGYVEPFTVLLISILPLLVLAMQVVFPKIFFNYRFRWTVGLSSHLLIFFFSFLLTEVHEEIQYPNHFSKISHADSYMAYLNNSKQEKSKSYKVTVEIVAALVNGKWISTTGKCLVYIAKDSIAENLRYGDMIVFNGTPIEVPPPANPSQFNYKQWLSFNQVYHQSFLPSVKWKLVAHHKGNFIVEIAINMREKLLKIFKDNNISGDDYAVIAALLLGDTGEIDQEILNAYAASGALHVLSVSGLHVGIIYLAFSSLLFFMDRNKKARLIKAGILILFLWYYALLTGLSPAVLRSAAMLSYIVIGKALGRYTNMYNTLAASAMTLFCFQPHLLMQVGFQLSYLAVLGIVFLYSKIHELLDPRTWLLKQIWSVTAVSLAAQLATFPLGILYFHQFPNYFLVSNLLVIPISTVIIYGGIILFVLAPFAVVAKWAGLVLGKIVHLLNWTVITIEHFPYSLLQGISISIAETYLIYFAIFMLVLFLLKKETKYVFASAVSVVLILSLQINESVQLKKQQQLIVYNVPKVSAVNAISGNDGLFIADSALLNNKSMMMFNVIHYWWDCGVNEDRISTVLLGNKKGNHLQNDQFLYFKNFLRFNDKTVLILNDTNLMKKRISFPLELDYLVLSKNMKVHLKELASKFHFKQLIIDSSNSLSRADRWIKEAEQLGIACYSVQRKGAFVVQFE